MDLFVKNLTNSYGMIVSSGYNDGLDLNAQTYPYIGAFSELDNTIYPFL